MVNVWITALKKWNTIKGGSWCVPRKGSEEYNEVKKIMDELRGVKPKKEVKKEVKTKTKKEVKPKSVSVFVELVNKAKALNKKLDLKSFKKLVEKLNKNGKDNDNNNAHGLLIMYENEENKINEEFIRLKGSLNTFSSTDKKEITKFNKIKGKNTKLIKILKDYIQSKN